MLRGREGAVQDAGLAVRKHPEQVKRERRQIEKLRRWEPKEYAPPPSWPMYVSIMGMIVFGVIGLIGALSDWTLFRVGVLGGIVWLLLSLIGFAVWYSNTDPSEPL